MGTLVQRCSHISVLLRWLTCGRVAVVVTEEKAAPSVCQSPSSPYTQSVFPEKQPSYSLGCVEIAGLLCCPRVSVGLLLGLYVSTSGQADTEGGGGLPLALWPPLQGSGAEVLRGPEPRPLLARRPAFLPLCFILLGRSQGLLCAWCEDRPVLGDEGQGRSHEGSAFRPHSSTACLLPLVSKCLSSHGRKMRAPSGVCVWGGLRPAPSVRARPS